MSLLNHLAAHEITRDLGALVSSEKLVRSSPFANDSGPGSFLTALRMLARRAVEAGHRRRARRMTVAQLHSLDPRILRDIGVTEMDIERVATDLAHRNHPMTGGSTLHA